MTRTVTYKGLSGIVILDMMKAAYLPKSQTLLVADLHFEKASYLQEAGNVVLPAYDTQETISKLKDIIGVYNPQHVVALGDSFHDIRAGSRIASKNVESLNIMISALPAFTWILGNHDPAIPEIIEGPREDHLEIDGFLLTHEPTAPAPNQTNICGHLHPKAKIIIRKRRLAHPCFACSDSRIILPSFGAYTGGLWTTHPAIKGVMGGNKMLALTALNGIFPIADTS